MNISLIVDILILAVLLYIAYKLHAVAYALSRILERAARDRESREASPAGQTINVNVAPVPGGASAAASVPVAVSGGATQDQFAVPPPAASVPAEPEPPAIEKKSAQSGPFSVKCSRCHAENSSYRTECFNCGNPL